MSVPLARHAVFVDFDGTMTVDDTAVHVLERLAVDGWRDPDADYAAGRIGSRECLQLQWDCVRGEEQEIRSVAREVPLDPGLPGLVALLRERGTEVTVVSDGYGFRAAEVAGELGLDLVSNFVDFGSGRVVSPPVGECPECGLCGVCKPGPIRDAARRGLRTVLIGDGTSDRRAAAVADVVFAKAGLAAWCAANDVAFTPFETLADIEAALRLWD